MSFTTPQLDCATAVAALLDGEEIAGFTIRARADEQDPVYSKEDIKAELKVAVLVADDYELEAIDRAAATETCPIFVGVYFGCERDDEDMKRRLLALLRGIAVRLRFEEVEGFGLPIEPVRPVYSRDEIRRAAFSGIVEATYRVVTEAAA